MELLELDGIVSVIPELSKPAPKSYESYVTIKSAKRQKLPLQQSTNFLVCPANPIRVEAHLQNILIQVPEGHGLQTYDQVIVDNIDVPSAVFDDVVTVGAATLEWNTPKTGYFASLVEGLGISSIPVVIPIVISSFVSQSDIIPSGSLDGRQSVFIRVTSDRIFFTILSASQSWPSAQGSQVRVSFTMTNAHIGGIPIEQIQANLPIDNSHGSSSKTIFQVTPTSIVIQSSNSAMYTVSDVGGSSMYLSKVISETRGYAKPSSYYQSLDRTYTNVSRMRLIATEFPCTVINIDGQTKLTYDGHAYPFLTRLTVKPSRGCYTPYRLCVDVVDLMNQNEITHVDSTGVAKRRVFRVSPNGDTAIRCSILVTIPKANVVINSNIRRVQFYVSSHGIKNGDLIHVNESSFSNSPDGFGYPATVLTDSSDLPDSDRFQVQVSPKLLEAWGKTSFIELELPGMFRFNSSPVLDRMGIVAGTTFQNVQESTVPPTIWDHHYFELRIRPDQPVDGVTPVSLASDFLIGRIRLDPDKIGRCLIDYHTNGWDQVFSPPLDSLSGFNVFLLWPDGSSPDFDGAEHVFTLGIREALLYSKANGEGGMTDGERSTSSPPCKINTRPCTRASM